MKAMKIDGNLERAKRGSEVSVWPFQKAETTEIGEEEGAVDLSRSGPDPDPDPPGGASISGAVSNLVEVVIFSFSVLSLCLGFGFCIHQTENTFMR